jgi:cholesterol oxidase
MRRLAMDIALLKSHYTVVVIGSGYGGGIAASRMARAKQSVCVLERGRELIPGEYPNTHVQALQQMQADLPQEHVGNRAALYDFRLNPDISVFLGCGLGGTSLVNANVSFRPDPRVLLDPAWPECLREEAAETMTESSSLSLLAKGYALAEEMLKPTPYPADFPNLAKLTALERSAKQMKAKFYRLPINVTFEEKINHVGVEQRPCVLCGDCVTGCNHGSKNSVLMNYLPDANNHGAEIFTEMDVRYLERRQDGKWIVAYRSGGQGREKFKASESFLTADIVILAAGTLGSTEILFRSREHGMKISPMLGKRFTGNGDVLGFGYNNEVSIEGIGFGAQSAQGRTPVGPCITGVIDLRETSDFSQGMVLEEGSVPGAVATPLPHVLAASARLANEAASMSDSSAAAGGVIQALRREMESLMLGPYHGAARNTQTYLVMTHDDGSGEMYLENDRLRIKWPGVGEQAIFKKVNAKLSEATAALGGKYIQDPVSTELLNHRLITVHPLGGCVMAEDCQHGVVNHKSQVFDTNGPSSVYGGLYVCDGAVVPRPLGVNPLLTISALAERACALIAADRGWSIDYALPSKPTGEVTKKAVGIEFTEKMTGYFSLRETADFRHGAEIGESERSPLYFVFTVGIDDLDAFLTDPEHPGRISGIVNAPALSRQPLNVTEGAFHLFVQNIDDVETRNMVYRVRMSSEEGRSFFLEGFKVIRDQGILNIWRDTTTLFITVRNADEAETVHGKGILTIQPADLGRQLSTMRAINAESLDERLRALTRFGEFFSKMLFQIYGGAFAARENMGTVSAARERRALRVSAPQVYCFETADKVQLQLTRYQGGTKGPVLLCAGLGVSSRIFSVDTIDTNLLEYLFANGYDVWLLDHRGSIDLKSRKTDATADEIALYDYPAAVRTVCEIAGCASVQVVAHCYGAMAFTMAMLDGLQGVRSAVCSQVGAHVVVPPQAQVKAGLHVPQLLDELKVWRISAEATDERWYEKLYSKALAFGAFRERCGSSVCQRITFMYGPQFRHEQLNQATHDALTELYGVAGVKLLDQLGAIAKAGHLVDRRGQEKYLANLKALSIPLCFIHGAANECYLPESTHLTYELLRETNGDNLYSRHVIPGYGHSDCIFGKNAAVDVYPYILAHLERTAT